MPIPANAPLRPASAASTSRKISFPRRSSSRAAQRPEIQIVTPEFKEAPPRPTTTVPVMREAQYVNPLPESDSRSRGTFGWLLRKTNRSTKRSSTSTVPEIDVEPPVSTCIHTRYRISVIINVILVCTSIHSISNLATLRDSSSQSRSRTQALTFP
jgi:hypothetical protein